MTQNQIRYMEALETQRANQAREAENYRSNMVKEQETNRANLENERLNREKLSYDRYGNNLPATVIRTIQAESTGDGLTNAATNAVEKTGRGFWRTINKIGSAALKPFGYKEPTPEQEAKSIQRLNYERMSPAQLENLYWTDKDLDDEEKEYIRRLIEMKRKRGNR